jgi:non-specific serine/threonine protein kinase
METGNDWFDLRGEIRLGDYTLPFSYIFKNLKSGNRDCILPDGSLFLIPLEWFSRFEIMARFGEEHGEAVRTSKAHLSRWEEEEGQSGMVIPTRANLEIQPDIPMPDGLNAQLRPYQIEGYLWLCEHYKKGLGACLADDMGLGKTLQTIAFLLYARDQAKQQLVKSVREPGRPRDLFSAPEETVEASCFCALIVMPSSLVFNWKAELEKFAPDLRALQHVGQDRATQALPFDHYEVILTSYAILLRDYRLFSERTFDCIILDESQQIKNKDSKTFKMLHQLKARSRITLSGTPIENSLADLWSQMEFINPKILGSFSFFSNHFLKPIQNLRDAEALEELRQITGPYILRRSKQQVNPDLPELTEQVFYCDMNPEQRRLYEQEKAAARNSLLGLDLDDQQNRFVVLRSLMRLRQLSNHPALITENKASEAGSGKLEDVCAQLDTLYRSRHKALIFSSFTEHLAIYDAWLKQQGYGYAILTGDTALSQREQNVRRFQEDPECLFFLISVKAGGTGLNLTAAEYVLMLDPWWNPFAERQAVARAHRIGQKNPVQLTRFISRDSIEEKILKLQQQKVSLSEELLVENQLPDWIGQNLELLLG